MFILASYLFDVNFFFKSVKKWISAPRGNLTIPVVADGDQLTDSSVTEVVKVGLHKMRENFKIVRVWEETEGSDQTNKTNQETSFNIHILSLL